MSSDAIGAVAASQIASATAEFLPSLSSAASRAHPDSASAPQDSFGQMVARGLEQVNDQLLAGQADLQQLALGNTANLHQIMIRLEESRLSFQLLMQVRNRLLESYQDVMKMQV